MKKNCFLLCLLAINSVAYSQAPAIEWQKCFGGSWDDGAYSLIQTPDNGFILVGSSESNDGDVSGNHGGTDVWVVKTDENRNIIWQKCLGGTNYDRGHSIQITSDGGYIVAGFSNSINGQVIDNHGDYDMWIIKLDNSGNIIWQKCLGGSDYEEAQSIVQTADGGFIVTGSTKSYDGDVIGIHGSSDVWVVKLDNSGNIIWQKCLGGSGFEKSTAIELTTDGGYIISGYSSSLDGDLSGNNGLLDCWIIKLDNSGNITWQKSFGGSLVENSSSIAQISDGGYILTGYTASNDGDVIGNHGAEDIWVLKLNMAGDLVWQKSLGGSFNERASSILETSDGGYVLTGSTSSDDGDVSGNHGGFNDIWTVKLDSFGNVIWQKCIGGTGEENASTITSIINNEYVISGFSESNNGDINGNHGYGDFWIVKLSNGTSNVFEQALPQKKELLKILNLLGQEVQYTPNTLLIYQYSNGTTEKVFTSEK